jgi:hypothetical protein
VSGVKKVLNILSLSLATMTRVDKDTSSDLINSEINKSILRIFFSVE